MAAKLRRQAGGDGVSGTPPFLLFRVRVFGFDSHRFYFYLSSLDLSPTGSMHENGSDSIVRF